MKLDEAGHGRNLRIAPAPNYLKIGFAAARHLKAVHGDEHRLVSTLLLTGPRLIAIK
jgi:hypothetical protein